MYDSYDKFISPASYLRALNDIISGITSAEPELDQNGRFTAEDHPQEITEESQ